MLDRPKPSRRAAKRADTRQSTRVYPNLHREPMLLLEDEFDVLSDRDWRDIERAAHVADEIRDEEFTA